MRILSVSAFVVTLAAGVCSFVFQASPLPVGYWTLDETASPSANFITSYGSGTWIGTPATSATVNQPPISYADSGSLNFNTTSGISIANSAELEDVQEGSYTLSAWVRPADVPVAATNEGVYGIIGKTGYHNGLSYESGQHFVMQHWVTQPAQTDIYAQSAAHAPAAWYHVTGVVDRTAGTVKLYVGANLENTQTFQAGATAYDFAQGTWKIGILNPTVAYGSYVWGFKGLIDDVRIYNYALSSVEVSVLAAGVPAPTALTATGGMLKVDLSWTAPPQAVTYTYIVQRAPAGTTTWSNIGIASGTTYSDTTGTPNSSYDYRVQASSVAVSGPSGTATAMSIPQPPRTAKTGNQGDQMCGCSSTGAPQGSALIVAGSLALALLLAGGTRRLP